MLVFRYSFIFVYVYVLIILLRKFLLFLMIKYFRYGKIYLNVGVYYILKGILINYCMRNRLVRVGCNFLF